MNVCLKCLLISNSFIFTLSTNLSIPIHVDKLPNNVDIDSSIKKELESKTLFPWQSK